MNSSQTTLREDLLYVQTCINTIYGKSQEITKFNAQIDQRIYLGIIERTKNKVEKIIENYGKQLEEKKITNQSDQESNELNEIKKIASDLTSVLKKQALDEQLCSTLHKRIQTIYNCEYALPLTYNRASVPAENESKENGEVLDEFSSFQINEILEELQKSHPNTIQAIVDIVRKMHDEKNSYYSKELKEEFLEKNPEVISQPKILALVFLNFIKDLDPKKMSLLPEMFQNKIIQKLLESKCKEKLLEIMASKSNFLDKFMLGSKMNDQERECRNWINKIIGVASLNMSQFNAISIRMCKEFNKLEYRRQHKYIYDRVDVFMRDADPAETQRSTSIANAIIQELERFRTVMALANNLSGQSRGVQNRISEPRGRRRLTYNSA